MREIKHILKDLRKLDAKISLKDKDLHIEKSSDLPKKLQTRIIENKKHIIEYLSKTLQSNDFNKIQRLEDQSDYVLSSSQLRLWLQCQINSDNTAYNISSAYIFKENLNFEALESAFLKLLERHESLHTVFRENENGEVRQHIEPLSELDFKVHFHDLTNEDDAIKFAEAEVEKDFVFQFDLEKGPLLRVNLYHVFSDQWILSCVMHHIVSDGWSMDILVRELMTYYRSHVEKTDANLPPLPIQYKDYAAWQQEWLQGETLEQHKQYWANQLSGELPVMYNLGNRKRPSIRSFSGGTVSRGVSDSILEALKNLSQQKGGSLFMGLLTSLKILLYKYTGQNDIIIGCPTAGREHADLEGQIGFYLNMLPFRTRFNESDSFLSLFDNVRDVTLGGYEHQMFPFDALIDLLDVNRDPSRNPIFDVLIDFHDDRNAIGHQEMGSLNIDSYAPSQHQVSKYDLTFMFIETDQGLSLSIEYNSDIFTGDYVQRMYDHFELILVDIVENPELPISEINYISDGERDTVLELFNTSIDQSLDYIPVIDLFEQHAASQPDDIALFYGDVGYSYSDVDSKANQLAHYLIDEFAVAPGDFIGVLQERSEKMVISILAILKTGAAYLPIDPDYPLARREYLVTNSGMQVLLTQTAFAFDLSYYQGDVVAVDLQMDDLDTASSRPDIKVAKENPVYVIYTSGSTGDPKGCMVTQNNLSNYIQWANRYYFGQGVPANFGLFTPLGFDLTVTSLFTSLTSGGHLRIYDQQQKLDDILRDLLGDHSGVENIKLTPSHVKYLKELNINSSSLKRVIIGGEEVYSDHYMTLKAINPEVRVYNEYGPTETTVGCTVKELTEEGPVTIGKPIDGMAAYILDQNKKLCGIGVHGELAISGEGVSLGYLNKEGLTSEKFVEDPFRKNRKMYLTGDRCYWLANGEIQFLGRMDDQVKIRGYRIELGEIEHVLLEHPKINSTKILAKTDDDRDTILIAFFTGQEPIDIKSLKNFLENSLPTFMVPAQFTQVESMPLTHNGKINKRVLIEQDIKIDSSKELVPPKSELERELVNVYQEVLRVQKMGMNDNFFYLGGDSIKSIQIVSRLRKRGYSVSIQDILMNPELSQLKSKVKPSVRIPDQGIVTGEVALSPIQKKFFNETSKDFRHFNQSVLLGSKETLDTIGLRKVFDRIIEHHDALRMVFIHEEDSWKQINLGLEQSYYFEEVIGFDEKSFTKKCESLQKSIQLDKGPILKVCAFIQENDNRLLIIAHHLVIDAVSWRILFEDLSSLYQNHLSNSKLILPPKSDSFRLWMEKQIKFKESEILFKELDYWESVVSDNISKINLDYPKGSNLRKDSTSKSFKLEATITKQLFMDCNIPYKTKTNDILIAALSLALYDTFNLKSIAYNFEGHGRESIDQDIDVTRTVGWFTTIYPVVIRLDQSNTLEDHLVACKEVLHRIPNKGIGYGILRYLSHKEFNISPEINFNFLGDFGKGVESQDGKNIFEFMGSYHGDVISPKRSRDSILNISGRILYDECHLTIEYSNKQFKSETIDFLQQNFEKYILQYVEELSNKEFISLSPVDLTFKGLSQTEIKKLSKS